SRTARSRSSSGYFFGAGNSAFLPGSQDRTSLGRLRRSGGTSTSTIEQARSAAEAIDLEVTPNGLLAMTLSWSGGTGPYDVMIEPSKGQGRYESGIDDTSITVATEPDRDYCFQVFGSDGSQSNQECTSRSS